MKTLRPLMLFTALTFCLFSQVQESFGQCEVKYSHTIKKSIENTENGEIEISFENTDELPQCLLFTYSENTPYLLIEAQQKVDKAKRKVTFYGLAPARYTVRIGQKGCKTVFIGEHTTITVGVNKER